MLLELNELKFSSLRLRPRQRGQSMLELVFGIGMVGVIVGAIAIVTLSSLRNTQFSKNQLQATKLAQQNLEKVRTIKNSNFSVCLKNEVSPACSTWETIWAYGFGTVSGGCITSASGCTFEISNCGVSGEPFCLKYKAERVSLAGGFSSQIIIEDEAAGQKRVTSYIYWTDVSGEHSSQLVTVLGKI